MNTEIRRQIRGARTRANLRDCAIARGVARVLNDDERAARLRKIEEAMAACDKVATPDEIEAAAVILATPPHERQGRLL